MKKAQDTKRRSDCPISFGLDIFGDKWTLLILRDIMFYHRTRFSDFTPQEQIATNILADRLSRLEALDIIEKRRDTERKNQYIYSITQKGKDLLPTLIDMTLWGLRYDPKSLANEDFVERIRLEPRQLVLEIAEAIESNTFTDYRRDHMGINPVPSLAGE
jgi:DNA-binding HxlR family transcriptional regulator